MGGWGGYNTPATKPRLAAGYMDTPCASIPLDGDETSIYYSY